MSMMFIFGGILLIAIIAVLIAVIASVSGTVAAVADEDNTEE